MKKWLKTSAAIGGISMIGAASAFGLSSCGQNNDITVHYEQTPKSAVEIENAEVNKAGVILLNVSVINKKDGSYYPISDIHEKVLMPNGSVDTAKVEIQETRDEKNGVSIKFLIKTSFVTSDEGMWSVVVWGKELTSWTHSFEIFSNI